MLLHMEIQALQLMIFSRELFLEVWLACGFFLVYNTQTISIRGLGLSSKDVMDKLLIITGGIARAAGPLKMDCKDEY